MRIKYKDSLITRLRKITTESLAKLLLRITLPFMAILFVVFFVILDKFLVLTIGDKINLFLSSVIAMFTIIEGTSTYIQTRIENDRNRLQEVRDELEKVYAPIFSIFRDKPDYKTARQFVLISVEEKKRLDKIITDFPFLLQPITLDIWQQYLENLEPIMKESVSVYAIPFPFISHIIIAYDDLTDEYHKRVGQELLPEPSHRRRLKRYVFYGEKGKKD